MLSVLALASSLVWGTSDFFAGLASRRHPAVAVVGWTQGLALLVISVVVAVRWDTVTWSGWPPWARRRRAHRHGGAGLLLLGAVRRDDGRRRPDRRARASSCRSCWGSRRGDTPSPWAWVGMLVAIVGVTLASGPELSGDVSPRPVVLAGCAALGFGLALFCLDRGARESTLLTLWGMRLTSVTILVVVALVAAHRRRGHRPRDAGAARHRLRRPARQRPVRRSRPPGAR